MNPEKNLFNENAFKEFEERVTTFLSGLNRHERRAFCARISRKAGKVRDNALRATMSQKKLLRRSGVKAK